MPNVAAKWKVVLIVEDDSDGHACRVLRDKLGLAITVDWLPANGIGNIKRRGAKLIALARDRIESEQGCVAVLLDRDGKDITRDDPHCDIARICQQTNVPLILAVECLEAWLLADAGCAQWLGIRPPANADSVPNAKKKVERAYRRKTRRSYTRRARRKLADHADGSAPTRSPSLRTALTYLRDCQ